MIKLKIILLPFYIKIILNIIAIIIMIIIITTTIIIIN